MQALVKLLIERQYSIASIESLTAGLFASKLAEVSGASAVLKGALVTYQTSCKEEVLHVDADTIKKYGVISKEVADAMAIKGKEMFQSDLVVSFSGNAGPLAWENKEVGLVHMGLYFKDTLYSYKEVFKGDRNEIREQCVSYMCDKIKTIINKSDSK